MQHKLAHHRPRWVACIFVIVTGLAACENGLGIGNECAEQLECRADLQCLNAVCVPRCATDVECGEGFICESSGRCEAAPRALGETCKVERDCGPHLSCQLEDVDRNGDLFLEGKTCEPENPSGGTTIGNQCTEASDCRNGICQAGACTELCLEDEDCPAPFACAILQKTETLFFRGCFPDPD